MSVVGIIAEFNPFHNGHAYLLNQANKAGSPIIVAMSGNFTERGEAAFLNKWIRAKTAVLNGADLVIELPFSVATRSAKDFALGGVSHLNALNIDILIFGAESKSQDILNSISRTLYEEPLPFKKYLKELLKQGLGYPQARELAIIKYCPININDARILKMPNNILAFEYIQAISKLKTSILPLIIERIGKDYHDNTLSTISSANGIRKALYNNPNQIINMNNTMPVSAFELLQEEIINGTAPVSPLSFDQLLLGNLRGMTQETLKNIFDVSEGLENRILKASFKAGTVESLVSDVCSRRFTKSRIRRIILHSYFGFSKEVSNKLSELHPKVFHVLAANNTGLNYINSLKKEKPELRFLLSGHDLRSFLYLNNSLYKKEQDNLKLTLHADAIYSLGIPNPIKRRGDEDFYRLGLVK